METTELTMSSTELNHLERQVDTLMRTVAGLKAENVALKQRLRKTLRERDYLLTRKQQVVLKIKQLISQVKEQIS